MTSLTSIIAKLLNVKWTHIENVVIESCTVKQNSEDFEYDKFVAEVRPFKSYQKLCPKCKRKCPGYDTKQNHESIWRGPNLNGYPVELHYQPKRIHCPEHGVLTEWIPWQDGKSRFLADFNNDIAWFTLNTSKTAVCTYFGINWRTIENCIEAAHDRIESDPKMRLRGLRRICVDETSWKKKHKYITVVYDMDRNQVVWVHDKHGQDIFELFCQELSDEERASIEVVAGDGARWIDSCVKKYFPKAKRCIDSFHVVEWINEALDKTRLNIARKARSEYDKAERQAKEEEARRVKAEKEAQDAYFDAKRELALLKKRRGRPSKHQKELEVFVAAHESKQRGEESNEIVGVQISLLDLLKERAEQVKGTKYALAMNPENLNEANREKLSLIEASFPDLYKAYRLKEMLRAILRFKDVSTARLELEKWLVEARESGLKHFVALADKIERHSDNIFRAIECQANSAKSESTNTTIKALIKIARGFRNVSNLFALIMLKCSDLVIPLRNRFQPDAATRKLKRDRANERRSARLAFVG